ncbi:hypothetical protein B0O80DRAFT_426389 [Mortierella sp. GBAus27b]|nr:hypothetical protein B0O80DRAFT_426389 [Mortierella sp. GBAus27b]
MLIALFLPTLPPTLSVRLPLPAATATTSSRSAWTWSVSKSSSILPSDVPAFPACSGDPPTIALYGAPFSVTFVFALMLCLPVSSGIACESDSIVATTNSM